LCLNLAWVGAAAASPAVRADSDGFVGLRLLSPIYLDDVTMPGGRDYTSGTPELGWGLRVEGQLYVVGGLTLGLALGFAYNALDPQSSPDSRDVLTDVWGALLLGYRGTLADLVVLGGSLGVAYHSADPAEGGWGGLAELEVGVKLHPRIVVGAAASLELLGDLNQAAQPLVRVSPALVFELLL
jgi:hypothetical protein